MPARLIIAVCLRPILSRLRDKFHLDAFPSTKTVPISNNPSVGEIKAAYLILFLSGDLIFHLCWLGGGSNNAESVVPVSLLGAGVTSSFQKLLPKGPIVV